MGKSWKGGKSELEFRAFDQVGKGRKKKICANALRTKGGDIVGPGKNPKLLEERPLWGQTGVVVGGPARRWLWVLKSRFQFAKSYSCGGVKNEWFLI